MLLPGCDLAPLLNLSVPLGIFYILRDNIGFTPTSGIVVRVDAN